MKRLVIPALLAFLAACGSSVSTPATSTAQPSAGRGAEPPAVIVDVRAAQRLVSEGVKVLDVRTPQEFATGHLPGALNIPYDELGRRAGELGSPSEPVLLYCRSGRRSAIAARTLREKGFTTLYDLQAYERWAAAERSASAR